MENSKENQAQEISSSPLKNNRIYKLLIWENKLYSIIAFKIMMTFFYFHVMWGHSLINLLIKSLIGLLLYRIVTRIVRKQLIEEKDQYNFDLISEEVIKEIYVIIYVFANKAV
jgi:hypothetical protein